MYKWVRGRLAEKTLVLITAVILGGVGATEHFTMTVRHPAFAEQVAAARLMGEALEALSEFRRELGIPINPQLDPNATGLIGEEITELTTSLGSLEAKRTATNPAFAALMVAYFHQLGLAEGDVVAIGASGSFPALLLATLAAAQVLELRPLVIYSVGSSTYGANIPGFTFVEMLDHLNRQGILTCRILAVSPGGDLDQAVGLFQPFTLAEVARLGEQYGVQVILAESLAESIQTRLRIYQQAAGNATIKCFVNIGGAAPNLGETAAALRFPSGLTRRAPVQATGPERGLLFEFSELGVPVINLLNIKGLAVENGLPIDPYPLPPVGSGGVYYVVGYRKELPLVTILLVWLLIRKNDAQKR